MANTGTTLLSLLALLTAMGCRSGSANGEAHPAPTSSVSIVPDLPVSSAPFTSVACDWKDCLEVPHVYLEVRGPYSETGASLPVLQRELAAQGLAGEIDGPPFALFYDDPSQVAAQDLRSRVCVPIRGNRAVRSPLKFAVLPERTVAYAFIQGAYPEVPRAYPGMFAYLESMGWTVRGPIRETYLVPPGPAPDVQRLLTEVQMPVATRAR